MMKRKTSSHPTRIYTYGMRLPTEGLDLIVEQLRLTEIYRNALLVIELRRRVKVREAMSSSADVARVQELVAELDRQIAGERSSINAAKAAARSNKVDISFQRGRLKLLFAEHKIARSKLKDAKAACKTPEMLARFDAIQEEANSAIRTARKDCGLYWGSYLLVEQSMEDVRRSKTDPEFRRWDGCGRIGVQMQGGLPTSKIFGNDRRLRIAPLPTTGSKRGRLMTSVQIRVGSTDAGKPVWASFPFRMHRPLPADGTIKWAWIHRTFKGRWVNWDLQIVVESPSFEVAPRPLSQGGVVAIDLGWRLRAGSTSGPSSLRVGYWHDDRGQHGELMIPSNLADRLLHADSLRSIQDRLFETMKESLGTWLKDNNHLLDPGLRESLTSLHLWRSAKRLSEIAEQMSECRTEQTASMCEALVAWWKKHRHLYDWETAERDRALNARKYTYQVMAKNLTSKYAVIVLEDLDLGDLALLAKPEAISPGPHKKARHQRVLAAPSEFRLALKSAAPGNGCRIVYEPCDFTTITCHVCHKITRWDKAQELRHQCECGAEWDQDMNASINLLSMFASGDVMPTGSPSGTEPEKTPGNEPLEKPCNSQVMTDTCNSALETTAQGFEP
jgi:Putative transposase DNA-binding domain